MSLRSQVRRVGWQARWLTLLAGASWTIGAAVVAIVAYGLFDYALRIEDRGLRTILALAGIAGVGYVAWTRLVRPLLRRWSDVEVARRIEEALPEWGDRLSTAVAFASTPDGDDPKAGSAQLRHAVVADVETRLAASRLGDSLRPRPAVRAAVAAGLVCLAAGVLAAVDPESAQLVWTRLTRPWESHPWPKRHRLVLRETPPRLAAGSAFEALLADARGRRLPDDVRMIYRYDGQGEDADEVAPVRAPGASARIRKENVLRSFLYRAVGGDDDTMPWRRLEVADPPEVAGLEVEYHFPSYTGWPPRAGQSQIQALAGTKVGLRGRSTKPLAAAELRVDQGVSAPLTISADGLEFSLDANQEPGFRVERSGAFQLELEDREGFNDTGDVRYEIRAVADEAPRVEIDRPDGNLYVTPQADVPLHLRVQDDLAVARVELVIEPRAEGDEATTRILWQGPASVAPQRAAASAEPDAPPDERTIEQVWSLADLGLSPGDELVFRASAADYLPQTGDSQPRRISIITPEELLARLAERQSYLLGELGQALEIQREARAQSRQAELRLEQTGKLDRTELDRLKSAQLAARQIERALIDPEEGVAGQVESLLADMANNHVSTPELAEPLERLAGEIAKLGQSALPGANQELASAVKAAEVALDADQPAAAAAEPLGKAGEHQDAVARALESMVAELGHWDRFRRFRGEVADLAADQKRLVEETAELGRQTLTKPLAQVSGEERAALASATERQRELARRFEKLESQMREAGRELRDSDAESAAEIADALDVAREQNAASKIREAAERLAANQMGQALADQQSAEAALQEMLDALDNRPEQSLERLVKKLREAEQRLAQLRRDEGEVRQDMQQSPSAEHLKQSSSEQESLRSETEALARRLRRLQAESAERPLADASQRMGKSAEAGQQADSQAAADQAQMAEQNLADAAQQVAERRRQAEADLAAEQLAKLADGLKGVRDRQQQVLAETMRLEGLRQSQGNLSEAQQASVGDLAREQAALEEESRALREQVAQAEVFRRTLEQASGEMRAAAGQLERRQTGREAQTPESAALARFERMLAALRNDPPAEPEKPPEGGESGGEGGEGGATSPPQDGIPDLAQLKMLKLMQDDLNARTATLEASLRSDPQATDAERAEAAALAREQNELAELLRGLASGAESPPPALEEPKQGDSPLDELFPPEDGT